MSFCVRLIAAVREYPELYDQKHCNYHDIAHREKLWEKIAQQLQQDSLECRKRWSSIRDNYRKSMKNRRLKVGHIKPYRFEDMLSFLTPYIGHRERQSIAAQTSEYIDVDRLSEDSLQGLASYVEDASLRPDTEFMEDNSEISTRRLQDQDDLTKFFEAVGDTVRTFEPKLQAEIKSKIAEMVMQYELKNQDYISFSQFQFPHSQSPMDGVASSTTQDNPAGDEVECGDDSRNADDSQGPQVVKKKWTYLRDCYRKSLKRRRDGACKRPDKSLKYEEELSFLHEHLSFDRNKTKDAQTDEDGRSTSGRSVNEEDISDTELTNLLREADQDPFEESETFFIKSEPILTEQQNDAEQKESRPPKKLKSSHHTSTSTQPSNVHSIGGDLQARTADLQLPKADHLSTFFKYLEETVRGFPPLLQIEAKSKFSQALSELEMKNLMSSSDL